MWLHRERIGEVSVHLKDLWKTAFYPIITVTVLHVVVFVIFMLLFRLEPVLYMCMMYGSASYPPGTSWSA